MFTKASFVLSTVAASSLLYGVRYLFARKYLSYHAELTGLAWDEVPPRYQSVILGMLKMVGAGMLTFGVALAWLLFPFSRGETWASWAIFSLVCVHGFISVYVTIILRRVNPKAQTSVASASIGVIFALGALAMASLP